VASADFRAGAPGEAEGDVFDDDVAALLVSGDGTTLDVTLVHRDIAENQNDIDDGLDVEIAAAQTSARASTLRAPRPQGIRVWVR
jgi:hypothetical protein